MVILCHTVVIQLFPIISFLRNFIYLIFCVTIISCLRHFVLRSLFTAHCWLWTAYCLRFTGFTIYFYLFLFISMFLFIILNTLFSVLLLLLFIVICFWFRVFSLWFWKPKTRNLKLQTICLYLFLFISSFIIQCISRCFNVYCHTVVIHYIICILSKDKGENLIF